MTTLIIGTICIIIFHWVADYTLQKGEWATDKSTSIDALLRHTITYSLVWFIPMVPLLGVLNSIIFVLVTFGLHTLQDAVTSVKVKKMFEFEIYYTKLPNLGVFTLMGFDQLLHYLQLYILFIILL